MSLPPRAVIEFRFRTLPSDTPGECDWKGCGKQAAYRAILTVNQRTVDTRLICHACVHQFFDDVRKTEHVLTEGMN